MRRNAWRAIATLIVGAFVSLVPVLATSIATPAGAYPATVCATLQVSTTTPKVGEAITVTGVNFTSGASVTLKLKPAAGNTSATGTAYTLKTVKANSDGAFTTQVTMPDATTSKGNFVIFAASGAPTGTSCPADPSTDLSLAAAGTQNNTPDTNSNGAPTSTAFTGVNILILVLIAATLIVVGAVFTRRGRSTTVRR